MNTAQKSYSKYANTQLPGDLTMAHIANAK